MEDQGLLEQGYLPNLIRMFNELVHDDQVVPEDGHRVGNVQLDQVVHGNLEKVQSGFRTSSKRSWELGNYPRFLEMIF